MFLQDECLNVISNGPINKRALETDGTERQKYYLHRQWKLFSRP
jgi:hypothetical protein